jgi:hypothetical protein
VTSSPENRFICILREILFREETTSLTIGRENSQVFGDVPLPENKFICIIREILSRVDTTSLTIGRKNSQVFGDVSPRKLIYLYHQGDSV